MDLPNTPTARRLGSIITRWTYAYAGGLTSGYRYFGTCSVEGCGKEISLQKYNFRQAGNLRCKLCSKLRGHLYGVPVYSLRLWENREQIVAMRHDGKFWRAYVKCGHPTCRSAVLFRNEKYKHNGAPEAGLCRKHWSGKRQLRPYESNYNSLKRRAPLRNIKFSLSYPQFVRLCEDLKCHYCEVDLKRSAHHKYNQKHLNADHLDRKDSRKGYTAANTVPCCSACNWAKNVYFTYDEMRVVGAMRQGDKKKAVKLIGQTDTDSNKALAAALVHHVWKRKRVTPSRWNAGRKSPAKPPK